MSIQQRGGEARANQIRDNPEWRAYRRAVMLAAWQDPEFRAKMAAANKKAAMTHRANRERAHAEMVASYWTPERRRQARRAAYRKSSQAERVVQGLIQRRHALMAMATLFGEVSA